MAKARTSKRQRIQDTEAFRQGIEAILEQAGGNRTPGRLHEWSVPTKAGPLGITIYDTWVAGRFEDVEAAKKLLGSSPTGDLNPYSGKWNHHYGSLAGSPDSIDHFRYKLRRVAMKANPTGRRKTDKSTCPCKGKVDGTLQEQYRHHVNRGQMAMASGDEKTAMEHKSHAAAILQRAQRENQPWARPASSSRPNPAPGRRAFPMNDSGAKALAHDLSRAVKGGTPSVMTAADGSPTARFFAPVDKGLGSDAGLWVFVSPDAARNSWVVDFGKTVDRQGHPQIEAVRLQPGRDEYDRALKAVRRALEQEESTHKNPSRTKRLKTKAQLDEFLYGPDWRTTSEDSRETVMVNQKLGAVIRIRHQSWAQHRPVILQREGMTDEDFQWVGDAVQAAEKQSRSNPSHRRPSAMPPQRHLALSVANPTSASSHPSLQPGYVQSSLRAPWELESAPAASRGRTCTPNPTESGHTSFGDFDWVVIAALLDGKLTSLKTNKQFGLVVPYEAVIEVRQGQHAGRTITVSDNGGEVNVTGVDFSVPYWSDRGRVGDVTLAYRIGQALRGEPIDYGVFLDGEEVEHKLAPDDVRRYFLEAKESNPEYSDEQAWAVAWSRYCKYKEPSSPHCRKGRAEYLPTKGGTGAEGYGKIRVAEIELTVGEGPTKEAGKKVVLRPEAGSDVWKQANEVLKDWARRFIPPTSTGYWKQDFVVRWADGDSYGGTYGLNRKDIVEADLSKHVSDFLLYTSGLADVGEERAEMYEKWWTQFPASDVMRRRKFMETHDLGPSFQVPAELPASSSRSTKKPTSRKPSSKKPASRKTSRKGRSLSADSPVLTAFVAKAQKLLDKERPGKKLVPQDLQRYIRIMAENKASVGPGGSALLGQTAWAFIDKDTGDILKPASWGKPAKHARGNIFDENAVDNVTAWGPRHLRR